MSTKTKEIPDDKPMDQKHKNTLRRCRSKLVDDMEPEEVLLHMEDPLLLTEEDENKIKAGHLTRRQQVEVLLDIISRKGDKAYETLKKTIEKVHPHLTSTILEAGKYVSSTEVLLSNLGLMATWIFIESNMCVESVSNRYDYLTCKNHKFPCSQMLRWLKTVSST